MDVTAAMAMLDDLVGDRQPQDQYTAAVALYEAALRGLIAIGIPAAVLYRWVLKWATLPQARGRR